MADRKYFSDVLDDLGTIYDKTVSPALKRLYFEDLGQMSNEQLESAVKAHRRDTERGRFFPRPADLLDKSPDQAAKHLPPDAAWAIALQSYDEQASVVWTPEIEAARNAALPIWTDGDKIGARMAFRSAYEQMIRTADAPKWTLCVGDDPEQRHEAVRQALTVGLISDQRAQHLLPDLSVNPEITKIAGLIAGKVVPLHTKGPAKRFKDAVEAGVRQAQARTAVRDDERRREAVRARETEDARRAELLRQASIAGSQK